MIIICLFLAKIEITFVFSVFSFKTANGLEVADSTMAVWTCPIVYLVNDITVVPREREFECEFEYVIFPSLLLVFLRSCGHNAWTAKLQVGRFYSLSVCSTFSWSFLVLKWIIFFGPELFTKAVLFFPFRWTRHVPNIETRIKSKGFLLFLAFSPLFELSRVVNHVKEGTSTYGSGQRFGIRIHQN